MSEQDIAAFADRVEATLTKNGYPGNRVALPLERMYESAYEKGLNFNKVLDLLSQRGITHEKTDEKIVFLPLAAAESSADPLAALGNLGTRAFKGLNMQDMLSQAGELLKKMSPERLAEMQRMLENMTPEQREHIMRQARDMGLAD